MSLIIILGRPGGGKSYTAMEEYILPALNAGRRVLHNIAGMADGTKFGAAPLFPGVRITDDSEIVFTAEDELKRSPRFVRGGDLVVMDEFYLVLESQNPVVSFGSSYRRPPNKWLLDFAAFLRAHRHYGDGVRTCDIVLMTQSDHEIPPMISQLAEKTVLCKPSVVHGGKVLRRLTFDGWQPFARARPDYAIHKSTVRPRPAIFKRYSSYTAAAALEEGYKGLTCFGFMRICCFRAV